MKPFESPRRGRAGGTSTRGTDSRSSSSRSRPTASALTVRPRRSRRARPGTSNTRSPWIRPGAPASARIRSRSSLGAGRDPRRERRRRPLDGERGTAAAPGRALRPRSGVVGDDQRVPGPSDGPAARREHRRAGGLREGGGSAGGTAGAAVHPNRGHDLRLRVPGVRHLLPPRLRPRRGLVPNYPGIAIRDLDRKEPHRSSGSCPRAERPPSTGMTAPLTKEAASESR